MTTSLLATNALAAVVARECGRPHGLSPVTAAEWDARRADAANAIHLLQLRIAALEKVVKAATVARRTSVFEPSEAERTLSDALDALADNESQS